MNGDRFGSAGFRSASTGDDEESVLHVDVNGAEDLKTAGLIGDERNVYDLIRVDCLYVGVEVVHDPETVSLTI